MRLTRGHRAALCTIFAAVLYFAGLGRPALWEPDEGRYAEVAREMIVTGDYVTPHNDWVRYFEKPPLVYWLTAASLRVFGTNEFAVRCQAAVFSAGQVGITEALGEALFGIAAGLLAALGLALSPLFFAFARFATPDPALAFFFTAALSAFYAAATSESFESVAGRRWMLAASAMLAFGTLAKGPVALLLAGAVALAWLTLEGRIRDSLRIPWLACILIYLAIALPWFVVTAHRNPDFLQFFIIHEHFHRYLANTEHGWGPCFFIPVVIAGMWPWCYFAPLGTIELLRTDPIANKHSQLSALRFLMLWFGIVFIFFSIPRSKLGEYILPAFPPLAIIAGYGLACLSRLPAHRTSRILTGLFILNSAVVIAVTTAAFFARESLPLGLRLDLIAAAFALFAGSGLALLGSNWSQPRLTPAVIAAGVLLMMAALMRGRLDAAPLYSYRELARAIQPYLNGCDLTSYHHQIQALPFYTGNREILVGYRGELASFGDTPDALGSFIATDAQFASLWSSPSCVVLIANRNDLTHLKALLQPAGSIIGCEGKKFALLNRPVPTPSEAAACR
ncbi:MAG TPA: glycosyltransferase family 39 protein [Candidatus Binataceae bacterium]|nr:glycosyltransferase family 39 protein [Candidatus Binataceae bacterium]